MKCSFGDLADVPQVCWRWQLIQLS